MKISVVIATYNGEKYIKRQIDSIIDQSVPPEEIVITDDGSTDKTLEILKDCSQKNQNIGWIFTHNKHRGFVYNFINGIKCAHGDIVFLSDQDDKWEKNKISAHLNVYREYEDASLIHGEIDIIDLNNKIIKKGTQKYKKGIHKLTFKKFLKKPNYPGMSMSFLNSLFSKNKDFIFDNLQDIRTHDFLFMMLAVIGNGAYTLGTNYCSRTFTGENVALNLDYRRDSIYQRIDSTNTYIDQYNLIIKCLRQKNLDNSSKFLVKTEHLLQAQKQRLMILKIPKMKDIFIFLLNIKYLPSIKSAFLDVFITLRNRFFN
ncbi:glycosyltransferase [Oenococcus oeni]|uniref:glycosyltransferase n=4 Tax=Oenococcus oeni TaxID=1247 RepID=UPI0008F81288|nr:glycosyltransferase [Oenococcus oeni]OIL68622.1 hypothetical protein ATX30_07465 [Oenococcus oeni]OIM47560.1 hypothetical protein ATX76_07530 [Oenococcus oeni]